MDDVFIKLIVPFLEKTEYVNQELPDCEYMIVDSIYDYVREDDSEYAKRLNPDSIYGLFYVKKDGACVILIQRTDNYAELLHNILHETVHILDFRELAKFTGICDMRQLQDDTFFILWSEFHAEYLAYRHMINQSKKYILPFDIKNEFIQEMQNYSIGREVIELQPFTDFCVRLFGKYVALAEEFEEIEKYPKGFFYNREFLNLYRYLNNHRTFETIKFGLDELKSVFKSLEK